MELWYTEKHTPHSGFTVKVKETLHRETTPYQKLAVIDTYDYGKMLLLDEVVMLSEKDEYIYHEMIVHPSLYTHPQPEKVLIIGGGDGGTLREVIKHPSVKEAVLVEIDAAVMHASKRFFPQIASCFSTEKCRIMVSDGIKYVKETKDKFDIIIIDSTDPVGPAQGLYSHDFYQSCCDILKDGGILTAQSETPFIDSLIKTFAGIYNSYRELFPVVEPYLANIPTYPTGLWSFTMGSKLFHPQANFQTARFKKDTLPLNYYNEKIHHAAFCLPVFINKLLGKDS